MQSIDKINSIRAQADNTKDYLPEPQRGQTNTWLLLQAVLCIAVLLAIVALKELSPQLFSQLREDYAYYIDQVVLTKDGGIEIIDEE